MPTAGRAHCREPVRDAASSRCADNCRTMCTPERYWMNSLRLGQVALDGERVVASGDDIRALDKPGRDDDPVFVQRIGPYRRGGQQPNPERAEVLGTERLRRPVDVDFDRCSSRRGTPRLAASLRIDRDAGARTRRSRCTRRRRSAHALRCLFLQRARAVACRADARSESQRSICAKPRAKQEQTMKQGSQFAPLHLVGDGRDGSSWPASWPAAVALAKAWLARAARVSSAAWPSAR